MTARVDCVHCRGVPELFKANRGPVREPQSADATGRVWQYSSWDA